MQIVSVDPQSYHKHRRKIIRFFKIHGEQRITRAGIRWAEQATAEKLKQEGTLILCSRHQKKLTGAFIVANYGIDESLMAVHRKYRNQHLGGQMMEQALRQLGKLYGRVATDNTPSLKMCLDSGLVAFKMVTGPTGKPTLWVAGGDWRKEEILERKTR